MLLLPLYGWLWWKKAAHGAKVLYGLAAVPPVLFLMNGVLLGHALLVIASLIFGVSHVAIVNENV